MNTLVRRSLIMLVRLLVGARSEWLGCTPTTAARIYFANHGSHFDTVAVMAALPWPVRRLTHPVAALDYWGKNRFRRYVAETVVCAVLIDRKPKKGSEPLAPLERLLEKGRSILIFPRRHARPGWRDGGIPQRPVPAGAALSDDRTGARLSRQSAAHPAQGKHAAGSDHLHGQIRRAVARRPGRGSGRVSAPRPRRRACARGQGGDVNQTFLFVLSGIVGLLTLSSVIGYVLERRATQPDAIATVRNLNARIRSWWVMVIVVGAAIAAGRTTTILLFALLSFMALREFWTLTPSRRGDHHALFLSFFVVLPIHYLLLGTNQYGMFLVFIPVYAFLLLPAVATLMGDTNEFLARSAKVQWGLMLTVFSISHAPALLMLDTGASGSLLIVYLIIVVQLSDVFQYIWGKLIGRHRFSPNISPSKTVEGLIGGGLSAIAVGTLLYGLTPFSPLQAAGDQRGHRGRGVLRRLRPLRDQARSQGEGLGLHHRRAWRRARPGGFADLRGAAVLPRHALLVFGVDLTSQADAFREGAKCGHHGFGCAAVTVDPWSTASSRYSERSTSAFLKETTTRERATCIFSTNSPLPQPA